MLRDIKNLCILCVLFIFAILCDSTVFAATTETKPEKYTLAYRFQPGEVLRWDVLQQLRIKTTISNKTDLVDSRSQSTKVWTVLRVEEDGSAVVEHKVEDVDMHKSQSELPDSAYNSKTASETPFEYKQVADNLNIPLSHLTVASNGEILKKIQLVPYVGGTLDSKILIPLPKEPVALGESWKVPSEAAIPQPNGTIKKIKLQQNFVLESVKNGLAIVKYSTICLTPVDEPKLEAQILDKLASGQVTLDLDTGHILSQQTDVKGQVIGFEGDASSIAHTGRFVETLK